MGPRNASRLAAVAVTDATGRRPAPVSGTPLTRAGAAHPAPAQTATAFARSTAPSSRAPESVT